jgi:pSer/pThr/pTyr-binding forkhead associated (FHA) protein
VTIASFTLQDTFGRTFQLNQGANSIGREVGNTVCLGNNATVSRAHAQLFIDETSAVLTDLGSANGTGLNGNKVISPMSLKVDDVITLGSASLTFKSN